MVEMVEMVRSIATMREDTTFICIVVIKAVFRLPPVEFPHHTTCVSDSLVLHKFCMYNKPESGFRRVRSAGFGGWPMIFVQ